MQYIIIAVVVIVVLLFFNLASKFRTITIFEYQKGLKYEKGRFCRRS